MQLSTICDETLEFRNSRDYLYGKLKLPISIEEVLKLPNMLDWHF